MVANGNRFVLLAHLGLPQTLIGPMLACVRLLLGLLERTLYDAVGHGCLVPVRLVIAALLEDLLVALDFVLVDG